MKPYLVFYAGLLYDEYDKFPRGVDMPDGAYLFINDGISHAWYYCIHASWSPINLCDVPKELRTYMLLLT